MSSHPKPKRHKQENSDTSAGNVGNLTVTVKKEPPDVSVPLPVAAPPIPSLTAQQKLHLGKYPSDTVTVATLERNPFFLGFPKWRPVLDKLVDHLQIYLRKTPRPSGDQMSYVEAVLNVIDEFLKNSPEYNKKGRIVNVIYLSQLSTEIAGVSDNISGVFRTVITFRLSSIPDIGAPHSILTIRLIVI